MKKDSDSGTISRRDFLARSARAGALIALTGSLGYALHDGKGPGSDPEDEPSLVTLPDFSMEEHKGKMAVVTGADRVQAVNLAFKALGGIEQFIKKGDRVLLKVNAAFALPASLSATTNPELTGEVVRLCLKAGAASVVVTDNPINTPESCFALSGIGEAVRAGGASIHMPKESSFSPTSVPGAKLITKWPILYAPFHGVSKLIGVAPVKDHHRSGGSMAMKNWYGLMGGRRNIFHQNIHDFIAELSLMVKPTLVILDGITAMMTNGPTGGSLSDLKQTNTLIVSTDQVAADALGATLLGRPIQDLPFILKAQAAGAGTADFESLKLERLTLG